ncbi:MAG TPA: hypothetical protein DD640_02445 [Clostridiales bacterium]|nr:hypothetical protein [Clostridiales bacterium]
MCPCDRQGNMSRNPKRLQLQTLYNVRDLGGFSASGGRVTAHGRFLRSDAPVRLNAHDLQLLLDYPIHTVIDLRSLSEIQDQAPGLRDHPAVTYHNIPLLGSDLEAEIAALPGFEVGREQIGLPDLYVYLLDHARDSLGQVFRLLAEVRDNGACLFHCSHGKDRTGLVAALLLMLAGVSDPDIVEDYQISSAYLKPWFDTFISSVPEDTLHFFQTDPQNMILTLNYFRRHYDSAENFMLICGLNQKEITRLQEKMLS